MKRVLLPILLVLGLNFLLNEWFKHINKEAVIWELDASFFGNVKNKEVQYLILGNSHSFGIETYENDSLIHFASYGENWAKSYYKLKYLIEHGYSINHLLLNYDITDTKQIGLDNKNLNYWDKYVNFFELGNVTNNFSQYFGFWLRANFMNYAGRYFEFYEYYTLSQNQNEKSQEATFTPPDFIQRHNIEENCFGEIIVEDAKFYLEKIVEICTENNIQLVLVKYPITKYHYYKHSTCFEPTHYYHKLNSVVLAYENVLIFDYQKIYFENYTKFRDGHHLSGAARDEFSSLIREELERTKFLQ
ncbi:hypothetical protein QYS48_29560 [Marivirga arenosa]|uniref:DUF1574 domain-containing protein n=1 Tax=Marivirga arenosa TaxID=3059076 RepID=A0AA51NAW2_9BACT|nr:hypothetical protein [Marivirga sp. ABR2-2]WMN07696.1 hypothetical protein QYS48_29560 [Marivirga sp. ABR2-2]